MTWHVITSHQIISHRITPHHITPHSIIPSMCMEGWGDAAHTSRSLHASSVKLCAPIHPPQQKPRQAAFLMPTERKWSMTYSDQNENNTSSPIRLSNNIINVIKKNSVINNRLVISVYEIYHKKKSQIQLYRIMKR